ncbi:GntR family transcriptional regulator [Brevibacillus panacihumi]|uniref:GntR family transcriptional regulator n=1 Tax=Brevibacillus panacihumi TaxID=497735 RepID=A0A3M8CX06_9BACL|nr:GntR family transcriptional regulator [Brevibacillus panacihumi]RNB79777.1 GntR family transcriptional regulator [Brevibacillus panacihumi]
MNRFNLNPIIKEETTKERVYKEIKSAILTGRILADEIFTEVKLAETLNTSRTPVRESLQDLLKEGLIISIPRKGLKVRKVTKNEMEQIFLLRKSIESEVIQKLASTITQQQIEMLKEICAEQEEAMNNGDEVTFISLDQEFHLTLTRLANYELVEQILVNLHNLSTLIGLQAVKKKNRMNEVLQEHRTIIQALSDKNALQAAASIIDHLANTKSSLRGWEE